MVRKTNKVETQADYDGFSIVSGGLLYWATSIFRGKGDTRKGEIRTAVALAVLTWIPLCILSIWSGTLNDTDATISFFEDYVVHVRYLFALPFLILIGRMIDSAFIRYLKSADRLIPPANRESFNRLVTRLDKLTDSFIPEILMLVFIYVFLIIDWSQLSYFDSGRNYLAYPGTEILNPAGWFYLLFSAPVFQLVLFRWIWRWLVWVYSVYKISRYKLHLESMHGDQMAGLAFLNMFPFTFSIILLAPASILSSTIGVEILYHGASLMDYKIDIILYSVFFAVVLYLPLLFFIPHLFQAGSMGVQQFGSLLRQHNNDYMDKWIDENPAPQEPLLGSMDHSSLADINGSYAPVQGMKIIPINLKMLAMAVVINLIPFVPLMFTHYSGVELMNELMNTIVN